MTEEAKAETAPASEVVAARTGSGFFLDVVPAALYAFAVFYGGSLPPTRLPASHLLEFDKLVHALAFGVMLLPVVRAVRFFAPRLGAMRALLVAVAVVSGLGGALELWQARLGFRSAELLDWVADVVGAGVMALVLARWRTIKEG